MVSSDDALPLVDGEAQVVDGLATRADPELEAESVDDLPRHGIPRDLVLRERVDPQDPADATLKSQAEGRGHGESEVHDKQPKQLACHSSFQEKPALSVENCR